MSRGYILLHRKIKEHWLFQESKKLSKFEAWLDILIACNHDEKKVLIKNQLLKVDRGESIRSLDTMSKEWGWNKSSVRRFLELLKKDGMIQLKNETVTTRLTVCNYDSYQSFGNADETQVKRKRNANETQVTPNKTLIKHNKTQKNKYTAEAEGFWKETKMFRRPEDDKASILKKYQALVKSGVSHFDILLSVNNHWENMSSWSNKWGLRKMLDPSNVSQGLEMDFSKTASAAAGGESSDGWDYWEGKLFNEGVEK